MVILIPIIRPELETLLSWIERALDPCCDADRGTVFFSIDQDWKQPDKDLVLSAMKRSRIGNLATHFISCRMTTDESIYVRDSNTRSPSKALRYGQKSGPNLQFFISMRKAYEVLSERSSHTPVILCEVDTIPLQCGWVSELIHVANGIKHDFIIAGSAAINQESLGNAIKGHYNGNALYNMAHPAFRRFITLWQVATEFANSIDSCIAYDCVFSWILYWKTLKIKRLSMGVTDPSKLGRLSVATIPDKVEEFINLYNRHSVDVSCFIYNDNECDTGTQDDHNQLLEQLAMLNTVMLYHGRIAKKLNDDKLIERQLQGIKRQNHLSIVTISWNDASGLLRTIDSVRSFVSQVGSRYEFLVVDGGSKDSTSNVINANLDIVTAYISEPDNGIYNAMNKGISLASGDYVIFMNSGDCFSEDVDLKTFYELDAYGAHDVIYGDRYYVCNNRVQLQKAKDISQIHTGMCFGHQSAFFKTPLLETLKFNECFQFAADYEMIVRAYVNGASFFYIDKPVCEFHCGGKSESGPGPYLEAIKIQLDNFSSNRIKESRYLKAFVGNIEQIFRDYV